MATVTISRQLGSGGDEIGQAAARALRAPYLDKEIVRLAAARVGLPVELVDEDDERGQLLRSRLLGMIMLYDPEGSTDTSTPHPMTSRLLPYTSEYLHQVVVDTIREVAARGNAVIVGRSGQMILRDRPEVLHVHICAPLAQRVERIMRQRGVSSDEARRLIETSDRERADYLRATYRVDWQSPDLYDLIINTRRVSTEAAVDLIVSAARAREAIGTPPPTPTYERLQQEEYSPREAADLLMLNPEIIRHAVYNGELPAVRAGKDLISIRRHDLLTWLNRRLATTS